MSDVIQTLNEEIEGLEGVVSEKEKALSDYMDQFVKDESKYGDEENKKSLALEDEVKKAKADLIEKRKELGRKKRLEEARIAKLEKQRKEDKSYAAANRETDEEKAVNAFSFQKAFSLVAKDAKLEGAEKDIYQLAEKEAEASGQPIMGQFAIPSWMVEMRNEKQIKADKEAGFDKAMSVGTATTGGHGVATTTMPLIPVLRPKPKAITAGTQVVSGVRNNLKFYRHTTVETAAMNSEVGVGTEQTPTFDTFNASPHRIEGFTTISKLLLIQNPEIGERWIRNNLNGSLEQKIDQQILAGTGAGNEIEGIENISGIGSVAWNASDPYATLVDLETSIATANADVVSMAHLVHPVMRGSLKKERIDAGSGIMVWGPRAEGPVGYPAHVSTLVPINAVPDPDEYYHYFGNWADGTFFIWGAIDFVRDEYSKSRNAQIDFVINMWGDYAINHPASMALVTDAVA